MTPGTGDTATFSGTTAGTFPVTVTITGTAATATDNVVVNPIPDGPSVTLTCQSPILVGGTSICTATPSNPPAEYTLTWSSNVTPGTGDTATFSGTKAGTFQVTVTITDTEATATASVVVNASPPPPPQINYGMELLGPSTLGACDTGSYTVRVYNRANGQTLATPGVPQWSGANQNGVFTPPGQGTHTVSASIGYLNLSTSKQVNVGPGAAARIVVEGPTELWIGDTGSYTAKVYDACGNLLANVPVTWQTANAQGQFTGTTAGTFTVTATAGSLSGSVNVLVRGATVIVTVVDNEGAALSGSVDLTGGQSGSTDSLGKITFTGLPLGSYTATATVPGFARPGTGSTTVTKQNPVGQINIVFQRPPRLLLPPTFILGQPSPPAPTPSPAPPAPPRSAP